MTDKHNENTVPLTLGLYELHWLRAFLKEERLAAEIDHEEVTHLHTDAAIRAAKVALNQELDSMTKVIEALDVAIAADDAREAIAKQIAATLPAEPLDAMTPPVA